MGGKIFINYRRGDDPGYTQALYQRLEDEFAPGDLFMDVEGHIKPGDDFVEVLNAQVAAADVMLTVMGPRWVQLLEARTADPDDFVTIEIKAALDQGKRVIPVLVGGAGMPKADALPESIRPLARRNAVGLRPERFRTDCQGLVTALKEHLTAAEKERLARTEAERQAAEAARLEAEAQAAARARAAEERSRAQAAAGLSAEEIRKAEELASWDFVKERNDVQDLRDHLARFPGGTSERYARAKLDALTWASLGSAPSMDQLRSYLDEFPNGANAQVAQEGIVAIEREAAEARAATDRRARETAQWGAVAASTDKLAIQAFLQEWPDGEHATAARARIKELKRAPTRRWVFQGLGGAVGLATIGGATWVELLPGFALWRLLHDQSFRTFSNVRSGIISPDGRTVLAGGEGGWRGASATLKLYDVATGNDVRTFKGHSKPIVSVAFSPDGRTALSISQDRTLKLWDVATGNEVRTFVGWPDSWGDKPLDRYVDYNATLRTPAVGICRTVVMAGIRKRSH